MFAKLLISLLFLLPLADKSPQEVYIAQYSSLAVEEMYRSGVPASITLAQGLLESRYGLSELAAVGNNHFGIKCHSDWKGKTMKVDDDKKGECFRVYRNPEQSFRDHSDFLRYSSRYKFLFDLPITDYTSWSYGLSKAGYATDPAYPQKLIRLIEEYGLDRYDSGAESYSSSYPEEDIREEMPVQKKKQKQTVKKKIQKVPKAATRKRRTKKSDTEQILPPPPSVLEIPEIVPDEDFRVSLSRKVYKLNGVSFVYAEDGDSYGSLAENYNLFRKEILLFNDAALDCELLPGTVVFIQCKKKQAVKGLEKYIVENDGESLRDISQRFAVRMSSLLKMNAFADGITLKEGDTIKLR